jgi:hypothetical protein
MAEEQLLSLRDIAELARVSRPVVSAWRQRPIVRGQAIPFPLPADISGGQERFRAEDVLVWLERTGRGNNPDARVDAPLVQLSSRDRTADEALRTDVVGLEALLVLKALTGRLLTPLTAEELVDLADETDPDDDFLYREVDGAAPRLPSLAARADALSEAAYGPGAALASWRRANAGPVARHARPLDARLVDLVSRLTWSLAQDLPLTQLRLVDSLGPSRLVAGLLADAPEDLDVTVLTEEGSDDGDARSLRRLAVVHGHSFAASRTSSPVLALADLGTAGKGGPERAIAAAERVQLDLAAGDLALLLGPAAVLTDDLKDTAADHVRADIVRSGRLRCIARLPKGLLLDSPRVPMALWILGPSTVTLPIPERWVAVADLADTALTPSVADDLVGDVLATLGEPDLARAHAYHRARVERLSELLARRGPLVTRGATPRRLSGAAVDAVVTARRLAEELLRDEQPPCVTADSLLAATRSRPGATSLDDLVTARQVAVVPGARRVADLPSAGTVAALRADDILRNAGAPAAPGHAVDALELEVAAPRAGRTEPGDVVFCTSPRPAAVVDRSGGSVVCFPARVLRVADRAHLVPEALAEAINALPATAREWRSWRMPRANPSDAPHVAQALRALEDERARLRRRHTVLDQLAVLLTSGAVTVAPTYTDPDSTPHPTEGRP